MRRLLLVLAAIAIVGCGSEIERRTINVDDFETWAGQPTQVVTDSVIAARVPVTSSVPEVVDGSVQGIEEISLFVQLQNRTTSVAHVAVYAHAGSFDDYEAVRDDALAILEGLSVGALSAEQIDARNFPLYARNQDALVDLILAGDFYLYVVTDEGDAFHVVANVPTLSVLATID